MSQAYVKLLVKEAKIAFGNKQVRAAEEKCLEVLNHDPFNYFSHLLLGAIYQEGNPEEAAKHLRKALECNGDAGHAFNGLLKCIPNNDIPDVCRNYLKRVPANYEKVHNQLETCALSPKTLTACIEILQNEVNSGDEDRIESAYRSLAEIYMNCTNIDRCWFPLFRKALKCAVDDVDTRDHCKTYIKYLKILKHLKDYEALLRNTVSMLDIYPKEFIPLEMVCWVFVNRYEDKDFCFDDEVPTSVEFYADKVIAMSESHPSISALMSKGISLYEMEDYANARDFFMRANNVSNDDPLCWRLLADCHLKLCAFTLAEYNYRKANRLHLNFLESLIGQNAPNKCDEVIKMIPSFESDTSLTEMEKIRLIQITAKALIQTSQSNKAVIKIELLSRNVKQYNLLMAYKLQYEKEYIKCLALLRSYECDKCEYFLRLGQAHFSLTNYEESRNSFLRATKIQPYNADCFYWLAKYYMENGDTPRARKCLEKSVFLNPQHEQGVLLLSPIYRQQQEWNLNEKLLQTAANIIPNTPCKWATSLLGFHHLALNKFDDAINTFRAVLRMDENNYAMWEGLADSYLKRGSFLSALKVYRKICERTDDNVYAQLQVANVLTTMRLHKDAISAYECLLKDQPTYLPALKGIADAHLGIANYYLEQRLIGRCKDHAEKAVGYLIRAIEQRNNLICLWRILANCFDFVAALPTSKAVLSIPGSLANDTTQEFVTLHGDKLYEFSSRFYCRAIKFNPEDSSLWYELSLNYYNRAIKYGTSETRKKYLELAAESAKHIIKKAPHKWKYWNLLGVICTTKDIQNLALAQHCFIKALELERKLAVVWTNLGILYLSQSNSKLANMAFKQAQQSEPTYANAWTGQAQVAEILAPDETIDLLRHSITLGYHDESAIQYAYWVCSLLNDKGDQKRRTYYIEHLNAVSSAIDSITWYCNANESNLTPEALSFLGYLNHNQRNWGVAVRAFQKATDQIEQSPQRDKMLCNLAYGLLKSKKSIEAVKAFENVSEATFNSTIGLAHSHFKAKQYENSYAVYEQALELLAKSNTEKLYILVALSSMVYAFHGETDAKSVLFQCIDQENRPIEALLSACALGILHDDIQLSELALAELKNYERDDLWCHHIAFLTAELHLKRNEKLKGLKYLYSQIHHFPDKPLLRKVLANYLLHNIDKNEKHSKAATRMVQGTIVMQRTHSKREMSSMDVAKLLVLASEAMRCTNPVSSKYLIQKAIHANPLCKEAWAAKQLLSS